MYHLACAILAASMIIFFTIDRRVHGHVPIVNGPRWFEPYFVRRLFFLLSPYDRIPRARQNDGKPFKLLNHAGEITVFPAGYANAIAHDDRLTLGEFLNKEFHTHLPGLAPIGSLGPTTHVQRIVKRLTRNLAKEDFRRLIAFQAVTNVDNKLGHSTKWRQIRVYDFMLDTVARISTRAIWGESLCKGVWLEIAKMYVTTAIYAAIEVSIVPRPLQGLVPLLSPHHYKVRWAAKQAKKILVPIVEERRWKKNAIGSSSPVYDDAIEWAEMEADTLDYNVGDVHLSLASGAVHTSVDLCTQALIFLSQREETVRELRSEIEATLNREGLTQIAFRNMRLLDSVLRETMRIKPVSNFSLQRRSQVDVTIGSELTVPKGESIAVDISNRLDPVSYPNPTSFEPDRFLRLRQQPGLDSRFILVATNPDSLGFGHGPQACPGRFFADMMVKILLCHLLLAYDWRLCPGTSIKPYSYGLFLSVNMKAKLLYRRRDSSIDLMTLCYVEQ